MDEFFDDNDDGDNVDWEQLSEAKKRYDKLFHDMFKNREPNKDKLEFIIEARNHSDVKEYFSLEHFLGSI